MPIARPGENSAAEQHPPSPAPRLPDPKPGPEAGESVAGEEDPGAAEELPPLTGPPTAPAPQTPGAEPVAPPGQAGACPAWT
jgi:hypothetical protein